MRSFSRQDMGRPAAAQASMRGDGFCRVSPPPARRRRRRGDILTEEAKALVGRKNRDAARQGKVRAGPDPGAGSRGRPCDAVNARGPE